MSEPIEDKTNLLNVNLKQINNIMNTLFEGKKNDDYDEKKKLETNYDINSNLDTQYSPGLILSRNYDLQNIEIKTLKNVLYLEGDNGQTLIVEKKEEKDFYNPIVEPPTIESIKQDGINKLQKLIKTIKNTKDDIEGIEKIIDDTMKDAFELTMLNDDNKLNLYEILLKNKNGEVSNNIFNATYNITQDKEEPEIHPKDPRYEEYYKKQGKDPPVMKTPLLQFIYVLKDKLEDTFVKKKIITCTRKIKINNQKETTRELRILFWNLKPNSKKINIRKEYPHFFKNGVKYLFNTRYPDIYPNMDTLVIYFNEKNLTKTDKTDFNIFKNQSFKTLNTFIKNENLEYYQHPVLQFIPYEKLLFNIRKHYLVPKYIKLIDDINEEEKIMSEYNIKQKNQFPKMKGLYFLENEIDPLSAFCGFYSNSLVRIVDRRNNLIYRYILSNINYLKNIDITTYSNKDDTAPNDFDENKGIGDMLEELEQLSTKSDSTDIAQSNPTTDTAPPTPTTPAAGEVQSNSTDIAPNTPTTLTTPTTGEAQSNTNAQDSN